MPYLIHGVDQSARRNTPTKTNSLPSFFLFFLAVTLNLTFNKSLDPSQPQYLKSAIANFGKITAVDAVRVVILVVKGILRCSKLKSWYFCVFLISMSKLHSPTGIILFL